MITVAKEPIYLHKRAKKLSQAVIAVVYFDS